MHPIIWCAEAEWIVAISSNTRMRIGPAVKRSFQDRTLSVKNPFYQSDLHTGLSVKMRFQSENLYLLVNMTPDFDSSPGRPNAVVAKTRYCQRLGSLCNSSFPSNFDLFDC